jgi:hypothetical protein
MHCQRGPKVEFFILYQIEFTSKDGKQETADIISCWDERSDEYPIVKRQLQPLFSPT